MGSLRAQLCGMTRHESQTTRCDPSMNSSPWSYYGRGPERRDADISDAKPDPTLGAVRDVTRTREQLVRYLQRTLQEFCDIRGGQRGYQKMIDDAMQPPPQPESIEETLRRLTGEEPPGGVSRPPPSPR